MSAVDECAWSQARAITCEDSVMVLALNHTSNEHGLAFITKM